MRSRTGCMTCRQRKLKCDEQKPVCGQCTKASRECVPSSGIVFRHQQNASMNGEGIDSREGNLKGFYAYKDTFNAESVWLDIPKQVTFIDVTDPYNDQSTPDMDGIRTVQTPSTFEQYPAQDWTTPGSFQQSSNVASTHGLEALSAAASNDRFAFLSPGASPANIMRSEPTPSTHERRASLQASVSVHPPYAQQVMSPPTSIASSTNPHLNFILNPSSAVSPPIDPNLRSPFEPLQEPYGPTPLSSHAAFAESTHQAHIENDHEIAFLLRHFSESPGQWMDLFDLGTFFQHYVPVKAVTNPLLKYAAVAYAAKALGRVQGKKAIVGGVVSRQARIELYPDADKVDWYHKGTKYYDQAVSLLRQSLQDDPSVSNQNSPADPQSWSTPDADDEGDRRRKRRRTSTVAPVRSDSDELLAATAILCVYEFLDASGVEWSRHLNGAKSLIDIAKDGMMRLQLPSPGRSLHLQRLSRITKARKATFWNLARQDMLAAFINETHTRLDTEDLPMWKEAGLLLDDRGFVQPSNTTASGYPEGEDIMKEDMISNALIWLMSKLVNFMANGDQLPPEMGHSWQGMPQRALLDTWHHLKNQFQAWYDGLPLTFRPCARVYPDKVPSPLRTPSHSAEALFPEVWYSIPMCASTMQSYHMSQIQLLMNKPHESTQGRSTIFARFNSYEHVVADSQQHSKEIISIALSRPEASVRIHSVQPLYTAGQCLTDQDQRRLVLRLLRDIERDTGWATEYRVKQLLSQWQWVEGRDFTAD